MDDDSLPYPRICAHRGFNKVAPENSLPAFGAAYALGADEIEFDLWVSADGEIIVSHDPNVERISDGKGFIKDLTFKELSAFDTGKHFNAFFEGLTFFTLEDVLKKFACRVIMNIHIKSGKEDDVYSERAMEKIVGLLYKYGCSKHVYFMGSEPVMKTAIKIAPEINRCMGAGGRPWEIVERGLLFGCKKVQLFKPNFNREMVEKAHKNGLICNVFYADNAHEALEYREMEIDTILTNNCLEVLRAVKKHNAVLF